MEPGIYIHSAKGDCGISILKNFFTDAEGGGITASDQEAVICFGPQVGRVLETQVREVLLAEKKIIFGKRFLSWRNWISDLSRQICLQESRVLKPMGLAQKRKILRKT